MKLHSGGAHRKLALGIGNVREISPAEERLDLEEAWLWAWFKLSYASFLIRRSL
jgi:hypothetical protein